ncbi:sensor histidine kinase [Wenzhouxiangella sp. EGI_FJ10305]|uniref:sensor histidine kinase n=1 Tax=Wenzhouxiangella sp. EGI_FJ10305 TaxID=3243768 RepID=UPI0035DB9F48
MTFGCVLVVGAARSYTGVMDQYWKNGARELVTSPLAWASYAAWAAVWLSVSPLFGRPEATFPSLADGLLLGWLALWVLCLLDESFTRQVRDVLLVGLAGMTAVILWLVPAGSMPILMILLVTQFAVRLNNIGLTLALVALNLYFGGVMIGPWEVPLQSAARNLLGLFAFQIFAVMVMRYAMKSERMAEDLKTVNARLLATRSLLGETARDQERLRLSRELHDVAGHKVTALKLNLRGLSRSLDDEAAAAQVGKATDLADELLQDLRSVVKHLRQTEGIELSESLRELARPFPRPRLELKLDEHTRVPRADQAETLLRVVQEALTNAARHGPAESLRVHLQREVDRLVLTIEDDGRVSGDIRPGNGLTGMRERLAELDGSLEIARSDTGGLKLVATLPLEPH